MDARSTISTRLITGKNSVINTILEPIAEIERKLKYLSMQVLIPITDSHSCDVREKEFVELEAYEWLAHKKGAKMLINQQKDLIAAAKQRFENEAKALNFARLEKEAEIAKNAAEQATRQTEERIKKEQEEKKIGDQAKINVDKRVKEAEGLAVDDFDHKKAINLEAASQMEHLLQRCHDYAGDNIEFTAKEIIKAIYRGEMPHLTIKY